jgi:penicillin-binding protein 1C
MALWVSSLKLPDISALSERKVSESTKIYDRTGAVLLYDLNAGEKRTVVPYSEISRNVKNATVAIEDSEFWQHRGVRFKAIVRAVLANTFEGNPLGGQGGSTITQQVVKNSLLTSEKKISRKLKEWVLAGRLEQTLSKEDILALYLNEIPYGGTLYGVEEAARAFFGKGAADVTVAEAAYLAAIPNAPTYYSPYGNHRNALEERKNLVLRRMLESRFVDEKEYEAAKAEQVRFNADATRGIVAPHFVMFVRQYLEEQYGREALQEGGFTVITTLDAGLQKVGEEIVKKHALANTEKFDAENAALVAIDPKTGQILTMVGSRDYFDKTIDGNFNATIAYRQPGSAIKPFVYAEALAKGFTPETVVFDLPTEFSSRCNPDGTVPEGVDEKECYRPENYDGNYRGPITFRNALAQSVNVPAIQVLYLAGLRDSLRLAQDMGITTLNDPDRYGLTLVLGGGEVKLLDITGAYAGFAAEGVVREPTPILKIERGGVVLQEWRERPEQVLDQNIAREITSILSDNTARAPAFSAVSPLYFPERDVAAKTGTTNDYHDAWVIGYAPNIVVGAWAGNNDNRPMQKKVAAFILAPLWHEFMAEALKGLPEERFNPPAEEDRSSLPPIVRGIWQGGKTYTVDKLSGKLATEYTPPEMREEKAVREVHSILYWIDKNNPRELRSTPLTNDAQFANWEYAVRKWAFEQGMFDETPSVIPLDSDPTHTRESAPVIAFVVPFAGSAHSKSAPLTAFVTAVSRYPIVKVNFFVNNLFVGSASKAPWQISFTPAEVDSVTALNELKAVAYDSVGNRGDTTLGFIIRD